MTPEAARYYATKAMLRLVTADKYLRTWAGLLISLIIGIYLLSPVTVSLDGYSHLYNAYALGWTITDQVGAPNYFSLASAFMPNWLVPLLLLGLSLLLPAELALKLLVIFTFICLYVSLLLFVRAMTSPRALPGYVYVVLLPFALNVFFVFGFYGFLISTALSLLAFSLFLSPTYKTRTSSQVALFLLLAAAYLSNPFAVLMTFLFPAASLGYVLYRERRLSSIVWQEVWPVWPWVPIGSLMIWFSGMLSSSGGSEISERAGLTQVFRERTLSITTGQGFPVASTDTVANLLLIIVTLLLAVFVLNRWNNEAKNRRFIVPMMVFGATSFLYFVAPGQVGNGGNIPERILLLAILYFAAIMLAHVPIPPRMATMCSLLAVVSIFLFGLEYVLVARRLAPAMSELKSATKPLPPGSSVLVLSYPLAPGCGRWPLLNRARPERHWALAAFIDPKLIVLNNYEAAYSIFPMNYRDYRFASIINEFDPQSDRLTQEWTKVLSQPGPDPQFVISWGIPSGGAKCEAIEPPLQEPLHNNFDQIFAAKGTSHVAIWRRTP